MNCLKKLQNNHHKDAQLAQEYNASTKRRFF